MIVAGFGLRASADVSALHAAVGLLDAPRLTALAAPVDKADHPALRALADDLALPLIAVPLDQLRAQTCATIARQQPARYGRGSVAESSALAACGPGARLIRPRQIAPGGLVTVALAEGPDP